MNTGGTGLNGVSKGLADGSYVGAVMPEAFGAKGDGTTDDTTALTAWAAAAPKVATLSPNKTYTTTATITVPVGTAVDGMGATIKATATIAGPILDTPLTGKHANGSIRNVTLDCNNLAANGLYLRWFADFALGGRIAVLSPTSHGIIVGDTGATSTGYGLRADDLTVTTPLTGRTAPAGSIGVWMANASDCRIGRLTVIGQDIGYRNDQGNNKLAHGHVWGASGSQPSLCYDDRSFDSAVYEGCVADTPASGGIGFRVRNDTSVSFHGCRVENNSLYGSDNTVIALQFDTTAAKWQWVGGAVGGSTNAHRLARDFYFPGGGSMANGLYLGAPPANVVTSAVSATYPYTVPGFRSVGKVDVLLTDSNAYQVRDGGGTAVVNVNTNNGSRRLEINNGSDLRGYSDAGTTRLWSIDGGTGIGSLKTGLERSGSIGQTIPRTVGLASASTLTSGTLFLAAVSLPKGVTVSNIGFVSGNTAAVTPTHWWFGLYDSSLVQLAVTADQTSAAWAAFTEKVLPIATVAAGVASTFVTTYAGLHYLGIMVVAGTVPTLTVSTPGTAVPGLAPVLYGNSDTAQTTPPTFAHTATAITAVSAAPYAYVA